MAETIQYRETPETLTNKQTAMPGSSIRGNILIEPADDALPIYGTASTTDVYTAFSEDRANGVTAIALKPLATGAYSPNLYADFGTVTKAVLKANSGAVFKFIATNTNAAIRYFQIHDKATAPAGTNVPIISLPIAVLSGYLEVTLPYGGQNAGLGVGWAISTTQATFTDSATASEHSVHVWWL